MGEQIDKKEPLHQVIADWGRELQALLRLAVVQYERAVQAILRERCYDSDHIEHTLDGMLGFCFDSDMLRLYKKLCRHLFALDPEAACFYVQVYREMWDLDDDDG